MHKTIGKLFLVNGPPNSGKDAACEYLSRQYNSTHHTLHTGFKQKLWSLAAALYCIDYGSFYTLATTRTTKEVKIQTIKGMMSPRDMLIDTSESIIKPNFDKKYFGHALVQYCTEQYHKAYKEDSLVVFVSDCGFTDEIIAVIEDVQLKPEDVVLIKLVREGCSFANDSRSYVNLPEGYNNVYTVDNNGTLDEFNSNLMYIVDKHI